jgi:peptidoglycan/LPS O-acetylase OafA/YrhL
MINLEEPRPRLPALTSLRFFAALHVVFFHFLAFKILTSQSWFGQISSIGYVGVSFFFVLSGFILVYTYAGRGTSARAFWRARFARIYPGFAFSLLLTGPFFFFAVLMMKIPFFAWSSAHLKTVVFLVPLLLQAWVPLAALAWNSVAWSLSDEAFFYLLFPFLKKRFLQTGIPGLAFIALLCWAVSLAMSWTYVLRNPVHLQSMDADALNAFWMNAVKFHPLARLPEFLLGMACGAIFLRSRKDAKPENVKGRSDTKLALPLVLAGLLIAATVAHYSGQIPYPVLHTSLLAPAFAAIIYGFALRPRWGALLAWRPLVFLGDASYSLYLLHSFFLGPFFFTPTGVPRHRGPGWYVLYFVIALGISGLVYRFIEEPSRRKLRGKQLRSALPVVDPPTPTNTVSPATAVS